ncbi:MAG: aldo/keto reductase [Betaproteobacteria bacterium]|nr:MAG: aldo/keto reductase [Betaproteobacteria bacterium]
MEYAILGSTGLAVSRMAFGAMTFTQGNKNIASIYKVGERLERDVIPMMRRYGLGLTVWSPLASGFLSGKYTRESLKDPDNRYSGFDLLPFDKERGFALVEQMRPIAKRHGGSVAQVALAWLLSKKAVTSILLGATKLQQLEDNLAASDMKLAAEEVAALDAATTPPKVYPNWFIDQLGDDALQKALG